MKNRILYKVLTIIWLVFGLMFLLLTIFGFGSVRSIILSFIAAILFLLNSYLNWKKYQNTKSDDIKHEE